MAPTRTQERPPSAGALVPPPATAALAVPEGTEWNMDAFPTDQFNRLIPTQTIRMPSDLVVPVVQVVQLNPDTRNGGDVYTSRDLGDGKAALTRVGLRKVATAAAIAIVDVRRTDDGSNPGVCEVTVRAEMTLPTGQRIPAIGTKRIVMDDQSWASPAQRNRFQSALMEHVAARAENRAIRALLSLRGSYPLEELRKPFAVVTFAPNMNHPEVRAAAIAALTGGIAAAYGPRQAAAPELAAPPVPLQLAAGEDDESEGTYVEVRTNGHARVDTSTGEIVAERAAEPDWGLDGLDDVAGPMDLSERLAAIADGFDAHGPLTEAQKGLLRPLLGPLGNETVQAGIRQAFDLSGLGQLQERHGAAVIAEAERMGVDAFRDAWREMARVAA